MPTTKEKVTYWQYLGIEQLLSLQDGLPGEEEPSADELHFIIVHQVFELWFKLVLRELRLARDAISVDNVQEASIPQVVRHLERVGKIFEHTMSQWAVMETLTPQDFLAFRDKLVPASGFQSFQLRELEILLGLDPAQREASGFGDPVRMIRELAGDSSGGVLAKESLRKAMEERSLASAVNEWLFRTPIQGSSPKDPRDDEVVEAFISDYVVAQGKHLESQARIFGTQGTISEEEASKRLLVTLCETEEFLRATDIDESERESRSRVRCAVLFIESYRELPLLAWPRTLLDSIVDLEELIVLFRTRHVRMVERVIGRRMGTGGSSGVDYLESTLKYRIFTDLWTVRTIMLPASALPKLENSEYYGFCS
ncbi:MAG: tryptophan 2,3-dioxygenase [Planctomycetota bacterium]|jgi:tryptophan 2,3-dioxygenase